MPGSGHGLSRQYSTDTAECGWTSTTRVSLALWRLIWIVLTPIEERTVYHASVAANRTHIRRDTECGAEYRRCNPCHEPRLANRSLTMQANAMTLRIEGYSLIGN